MSIRTKITLIIVSVLVVIGLVATLLGPVLFASISYPLPPQYRESIVTWRKEYCPDHISPNFMAALIFTESTWRQNARSHVGAVGLTQFMPATANAVARQLGVSPFQPNDLVTNPDLSIRFGWYYICGGIARQGGNVFKALIAYNGGPRAVTAYEQGTPFRGTVAYANKVLSVERIYNNIYGQWWTAFEDPNFDQFELRPRSDISLLGTIPILDFWRNLLAPTSVLPQEGEESAEGANGVNNIWRFFLPTGEQ